MVQEALELSDGLLQVDDFFPHTILLVTHFDLNFLDKGDVLNDNAINYQKGSQNQNSKPTLT